ncbi:MAG: hypothetical protein ACN6O3_15565 [Comamonas sp.]
MRNEDQGFVVFRLNRVKLLVLLALLASTFAGLYFARDIDRLWGEAAAYRYAAGLPVLYLLLVVGYALYLWRHPERDIR